MQVLFVVSEAGYWSEECITPLEVLTEEGADITVATPSGGEPVIDERSLDPESVEDHEHLREVHETDDRLNDPIPVAEAEMAEYDALVLPGGHGTVWDINQDSHTRALLREAVEADTPALVVCHAVGILAFTRDSDGGFLVDGKDVTGFPNEWEEGIVDENDVLPDGEKLPYWVEDEVVAAGGNFDAELESDTSVTVDGALLTARGPGSSRAAVETLLDEL
ncbi:type 1 glutamine amidotransferase domain-containing protein [Natronomonas sp. EA1]|uniref:type 1 glutamine amidotransferase domain-containing protein n=1 Tax=Natronomonas sp. EA1 TaxID=3421655 RepID=UPI003EBAB6FA